MIYKKLKYGKTLSKNHIFYINNNNNIFDDTIKYNI